LPSSSDGTGGWVFSPPLVPCTPPTYSFFQLFFLKHPQHLSPFLPIFRIRRRNGSPILGSHDVFRVVSSPVSTIPSPLDRDFFRHVHYAPRHSPYYSLRVLTSAERMRYPFALSLLLNPRTFLMHLRVPVKPAMHTLNFGSRQSSFLSFYTSGFFPMPRFPFTVFFPNPVRR